jgi:Domain of unknown function (DUF4327)
MIATPITTSTTRYSIDVIKDEARELVKKGAISRKQPIYALCEYIGPGEWRCVECELEECGYLLRDQIGDLLGSEIWTED